MEKNIFLKDSKGFDIYTEIYEPETSFKGVVQLIHGASEHISRYRHFALYLNKQGYVVIGNDHRGHGKTAKHHDYVYFADKDGHNLVYEGVKLVRDYIDEHYKDLPVILFGHSMGSFIGRYTFAKIGNRYDVAIFSGTSKTSSFMTRFGIILTTVIAKIFGKQHVSKLVSSIANDKPKNDMIKRKMITTYEEWLSHDEEIQKMFREDKTCGHPFSVGAQRDLFRLFHLINKKSFINKTDKTIPILFISGLDDPLGGYGKIIKETEKLYNSVGFSKTKVILYKGFRHEVINEIEKDLVYKDVAEFIKQNI